MGKPNPFLKSTVDAYYNSPIKRALRDPVLRKPLEAFLQSVPLKEAKQMIDLWLI